MIAPEERAEKIRQLTEAVSAGQRSLAGFARAILSRGGPVAVPDVEDVLADAYITAATRLRNDETLQVSNYAGWFRRVLFFTCLEHGRRNKRYNQTFVEQLRHDDELLDVVDTSPLELRIALKQAFDKISDKDVFIIRRAANGLTSQEIADELHDGSTANSIRQSKHRALKELRENLGGLNQWVAS